MLDFDEAVRGDPALDLGTFMAHLHRDALRGAVPTGRLEAIRSVLLAGYRSAGAPPAPGRVHLYTAVALLRLAPDPFRAREAGWPERTEALLDRAEEELRASAAPVRAPVGPGEAAHR
jgi:hypothetical protein